MIIWILGSKDTNNKTLIIYTIVWVLIYFFETCISLS